MAIWLHLVDYAHDHVFSTSKIPQTVRREKRIPTPVQHKCNSRTRPNECFHALPPFLHCPCRSCLPCLSSIAIDPSILSSNSAESSTSTRPVLMMWAVALTNKSRFAFVTSDYCIRLAVHRHVAGASFKRKRKQSSRAQRKTRKAVAFDSWWLVSSLHIARLESCEGSWIWRERRLLMQLSCNLTVVSPLPCLVRSSPTYLEHLRVWLSRAVFWTFKMSKTHYAHAHR